MSSSGSAGSSTARWGSRRAGCCRSVPGGTPGRHLFPAPQFELTAVDPVYERVELALYRNTADEGHVGRAGELDFPAASFDVVLYREVLHHVVFQQPLDGPLSEAHDLLRPGGALVIIEPNLWHPIGGTLALANRLRVATKLHGTPDDVPLSPRRLIQEPAHSRIRAGDRTGHLHLATAAAPRCTTRSPASIAGCRTGSPHGSGTRS